MLPANPSEAVYETSLSIDFAESVRELVCSWPADAYERVEDVHECRVTVLAFAQQGSVPLPLMKRRLEDVLSSGGRPGGAGYLGDAVAALAGGVLRGVDRLGA
jgi:hypothetical protein